MTTVNTLKYFEEWAKNKSPLIRNASLLVATSSEDFHKLLKTVKAGDLLVEKYKSCDIFPINQLKNS